ncbi:hypothetical protein F5Y08DRAFT_309249 [Xylaria arbuscula]|nr:hypothetical protein F5Y08DRAFT_309249 [Xylaria arbuscula]
METPVNQIIPAPAHQGDNLFLRARELAQETGLAFLTSHTFHYERLIGHGSYGVTLLFREMDHLHCDTWRRIVLKLPLVPQVADLDFSREAEVLEKLRGHAHIVQIIAYAADIKDYASREGGRIRRTIRRVINAFRNPPAHLFGYLQYISQNRGPAILLEYLENGNMIKLYEKLYVRKYQLPNRLLWAWYHCLASACIAMTYSREDEEAEPRPVQLERPHRDRPHLRLIHDDIAPRNVMIDERNPFVQDHRTAPKLVMIDFGLARQLPEGREQDAERRNLDAINLLMLDLVFPPFADPRGRRMRPTEYNGIRTEASGLFRGRRTSLLDPELRRLLAESFRIGDNDEPLGRPSLQETFERTKFGMLKPPESYRDASLRETDDYIRVSLQRFLHDADWD